MRLREAAISAAVQQFMELRGYEAVLEFPILGKIADICGWHPTHRCLVAVECKERDWGRAIYQARRYQAATDWSYVAVPDQAVTAKLSQACEIYGLGLISVGFDHSVRILVEPTSAYRVDNLRARIVARIQATKADSDAA